MEELDIQETALETQEAVEYDFHGVFNEIYADWEQMNYQVSDAIDERMKELLTHTEDELETETYMKVLYLEGMKYEQQENKNGARFCAMRMHWIKECFVNPKKKRPRFLIMSPYTIPVKMDDFIGHYTDFLEGTYKDINKKMLIITTVMFTIVFVVFAFVLKFGVLMSGIVSILLGMFNYFLQKRRLKDMFQKNQTNAIEEYVEDDVLDFDRPVRYS